ncbi:MAG TPA: TonB-dependent receptor [Candidatus Limnocylindria bacterium]|nr:TonB-dependent receptor [Candidatus Limnocylindria bacterium]
MGSIKVPVVYGASKHEQSLSEAPASVSIVSRDEIQKFGYRTLSEILNGVTGFYTTYDRGYSFIGVRGVNRPGDFGGRLLITVDGQRINDPIFGQNAGGIDFVLDVDLIEQVEVIRGAGSSLYGNNAFFGVINVVTRKGADVGGGELSASGGSLDTRTGRFTYGNQFKNGLEMLLSGSLYDSAGNRRLSYPEFSAIHEGVAENMDGGWARSAFASVSWKALSFEGGFVDRRKTWPTAPYSTDTQTVIFDDPRFFTIDERAFAALKLETTLESEWKVMARSYYDHYRFDGQYPVDYFDPLQPVYLNRDLAQAESVGCELQVSRSFFEKHLLTAGVEVRYEFRLDQKNYDISPEVTYLDSHATATIYSAFLQDEYRLGRQLVLNVGGRYDHFNAYGDALNPRAALIYEPTKSATVKLIYGQAFREPNEYESDYVAFGTKANPNLGPEKVRSYELVYEQKLGQNWRANGSLFYTDAKGLIGYREDPADGQFFFDNVTDVNVKGVAGELEGQWAGGLRTCLSYTFSDTRDAMTGAKLSNSPEHLAKLALSVPVWRQKVFASLDLQAMSDRQTEAGSRVGAYWLANTTLFSRELAKGLELSVSVYNLFDRHYRDPVSPDFAQDSIPQDGRTFRVKLGYCF